MPAQPTIFCNRARRIVDAAFIKVAGKLLFFSHLRPFSYWDNYYGEHPEITEAFFRLLHYPTLQRYDNKGFIASKINSLNISDLFPASFTSVSDALDSPNATNKIWFIKPTCSTSGKGIQCLTAQELAEFQLPPHHIIQEQVAGIELINAHKYTARAYVLIYDKRVFLFDDGFVMIHGVPYSENATDFAVQVDHSGYTEVGSAIKMMRMAELPNFELKLAQLKQKISFLKPVLSELIAASSTREYGLLGIDLLYDKHNNPTLIEINSKANFVHTDTINHSLNIPFFAAVIGTLYTHIKDTRLIEI